MALFMRGRASANHNHFSCTEDLLISLLFEDAAGGRFFEESRRNVASTELRPHRLRKIPLQNLARGLQRSAGTRERILRTAEW